MVTANAVVTQVSTNSQTNKTIQINLDNRKNIVFSPGNGYCQLGLAIGTDLSETKNKKRICRQRPGTSNSKYVSNAKTSATATAPGTLRRSRQKPKQ
jgi:hypothetical protein